MITVCIPTIPSRRALLERCVSQVPEHMEILVADGERPMGDKLNEMFAAATGSHVICVDDDDYLIQAKAEWLHIASDWRDFVGYRILYTEDGIECGSVAHRGDGDTTWSTFDRGPSPKCVVHTAIARRHPFGNHYTADREWSEAIAADIETFSFWDLDLYHYDHWNAHMVGTTPAAGRLHTPQRTDVGTWAADWERVRWI